MNDRPTDLSSLPSYQAPRRSLFSAFLLVLFATGAASSAPAKDVPRDKLKKVETEMLWQKKQADDLAHKIGPEFVKFMDALDQADDRSSEGKELIAAVETLDKLCPAK